MSSELITVDAGVPTTGRAALMVPALIARLGPKARKRFIEFFVAQHANPNTRAAYARDLRRFTDWCEAHNLRDLDDIEPIHVAAYVEELGATYKVRTVKRHTAAIRMCLDYLVTGGIIGANPASTVRGPKLKVKKGVTPTLEDDQVLDLLESIDVSKIAGLRDRAIIATMLFAWPRVSAVCNLRLRDYENSGRNTHLFLGKEKGGTELRVLFHHKGVEYVDAYIHAANIAHDREGWLFRALGRTRLLTDRPLHRCDVLAMVKRRAKNAGLDWRKVCNHSFRATGITNYMSNGGRIDAAREQAGHADERTTGLYDHSTDKMTKAEIERMRFERSHTKRKTYDGTV